MHDDFFFGYGLSGKWRKYERIEFHLIFRSIYVRHVIPMRTIFFSSSVLVRAAFSGVDKDMAHESHLSVSQVWNDWFGNVVVVHAMHVASNVNLMGRGRQRTNFNSEHISYFVISCLRTWTECVAFEILWYQLLVEGDSYTVGTRVNI